MTSVEASAGSPLTRLFMRALAFYVRQAPSSLRHWRMELLSIRLSDMLRNDVSERTIRTRHGFSMVVNGQSQNGRVLYATGGYEEDVGAVIRTHLREGQTFVDGGAHLGFFSLLASRLVGRSGRVVAFEPSKATRELLARNIALNGCGNVTIHAQALGHGSGVAALTQGDAGQSGQASLRAQDRGAANAIEPVDVIALDSLADSVGPIHVVKLDLEGFELEALKGMRRLLEVWHPLLIVEVTDEFLRASNNGSASQLYEYLQGVGYHAHVITEDGLKPVASAAEWRTLPAQFNAVFIAAATG